MESEQATYLVAFARLELDPESKRVSIKDDAIHFGGIATTEQEADQIARECVRATPPRYRAFTLPRIFLVEGDYHVISEMFSAQEKFETIISGMNEQSWMLEQPAV